MAIELPITNPAIAKPGESSFLIPIAPQTIATIRLNFGIIPNIVNKGIGGLMNGEITIKTYLDHSNIIIEISDNGKGIPKEIISKIFNPFFTTKKAGEGTGLGLSIVYKIIRDHGGSIDVVSELGKGSTFTIKLPTHLPRGKIS